MRTSQTVKRKRENQETQSFVLNTLDQLNDSQFLKKSCSENKLVQNKKEYIMIQPKLIQFVDQSNNTQQTQLSFQNSIKNIKTLEINDFDKEKVKSTKSAPLVGQSQKRKEQCRQSIKIITQL